RPFDLPPRARRMRHAITLPGEVDDLRNSDLSVAAGIGTRGRKEVRRGAGRTGQGVATGCVLSYRGRAAQPHYPYLAVGRSGPPHPGARAADPELAAEDPGIHRRDGEQDRRRGAVLPLIRAAPARRSLRNPDLHDAARLGPDGDRALGRADRRAGQTFAT